MQGKAKYLILLAGKWTIDPAKNFFDFQLSKYKMPTMTIQDLEGICMVRMRMNQ